GQLRKLVRDSPQIARENLDLLCTPVELCANTVEFVLQVNDSRRRGREFPTSLLGFSKPLPYGLGRRFRRRKHAFNGTKERHLCPREVVSRSKHGRLTNVA